MSEQEKEMLESESEAADVEIVEEEEAAEEVNPLPEKLDECNNRLQRLYADFDNYKKRTAKERSELIKNANESLITSLLPLVDNLERACAAAEGESEGLLSGVKMVLKQMQETLTKEGVAVIDETGILFDPHCHQVLMQEPAEEGVESNTVIEILQKGYKLNNKLLRPALVKIAQ